MKMANENSGDNKANQPGATNEKPIFLSNNFYNYRNSKLNAPGQEQASTSANSNSTESSSSFRNHFLAPLTDDSLQKYPSSSTRLPNNAAFTPSAFTDTERSHVLDRFTKIFTNKIGDAISSGKLSQAWQRGGSSNNGGVGSWLTTDYSKIYNSSSTSYSSNSIVNAHEYEAERDLIQPHLTPFIWGMTFSAVTLFSLRLGKWYQGRRALLSKTTNMVGTASYSAKSNNVAMKETVTTTIKRDASRIQDLRRRAPQDYNTYTTTTTATATNPANANTINNPFQTNPQSKSSMETLENLLSLPVDIALSLLIGISTTIYLTRPQVLLQDISTSPLLSGKSVLSEELCKPFGEEMMKVNQEYHTYNIVNHESTDTAQQKKGVISYSELWKDENLGEFDSLRAVRDFVANCNERGERMRRLNDGNDDFK
jgi:hypothetical protein